jgi:hypothetical protein
MQDGDSGPALSNHARFGQPSYHLEPAARYILDRSPSLADCGLGATTNLEVTKEIFVIGGEDTAAYTNTYYPIEGTLWNGYNSNTS